MSSFLWAILSLDYINLKKKNAQRKYYFREGSETAMIFWNSGTSRMRAYVTVNLVLYFWTSVQHSLGGHLLSIVVSPENNIRWLNPWNIFPTVLIWKALPPSSVSLFERKHVFDKLTRLDSLVYMVDFKLPGGIWLWGSFCARATEC